MKRSESHHGQGFLTGKFLEIYRDETLTHENVFFGMAPEDAPVPSFEAVKTLLPQPHWPANQPAVDGYWKAWELGFRNLRKPVQGSGFVSNFIDTAFNDCLFMWDSSFIVQFGRYGQRAFHFQGTLDNFYACQHPDGFICREIREGDGTDQWQRFDPCSTGPNVLAWAEWEYFQNHGDVQRLKDVFPPLVAFHRWLRRHRGWQNGSYWTSGLGCGMDNMQRTPPGTDDSKEHGWMSWVDATFQALLNARILAEMGRKIGRPEVAELEAEVDSLGKWVHANMWDDKEGFYFDRHQDGSLTGVKHVGAYWSLLAGASNDKRAQRMAERLKDPKSFNRLHRVPSLAADAKGYNGEIGDYWLGSVWPPTNYMILRGLSHIGQDDLAFEIAQNHHGRVIEVFEKTGTFWENYAPDVIRPGKPAKSDFVGWSGLPPIAVLMEYVFGLRPVDPLANRLLWDIRLTDEFGVSHYPLGPANELSLSCSARSSAKDEPQVSIHALEPTEVEIRWQGGKKTVKAQP